MKARARQSCAHVRRQRMSANDQNQSQPHGGERGTGAAAAPQAEGSGAGASERAPRHGRRRRGRTEQKPQQAQRRAESALNMDELRELTELFTAHGLTDFEFENADIRVRLSRNPAPAASGAQAVSAQALMPHDAVQSAASAAATSAGAEGAARAVGRSEEHTSELQSRQYLV